MSLLSIVSAIEAAFTATEDVVTEFETLKPYVTQLMNAAENTYASTTASGGTKLQAVLAATQAVAKAFGIVWSQSLEAAIVAFISVAKAAFNAFASVVTVVAPTTTTSAAAAVAAVNSAASTATQALAATV
jgi:hypothetical protein